MSQPSIESLQKQVRLFQLIAAIAAIVALAALGMTLSHRPSLSEVNLEGGDATTTITGNGLVIEGEEVRVELSPEGLLILEKQTEPKVEPTTTRVRPGIFSVDRGEDGDKGSASLWAGHLSISSEEQDGPLAHLDVNGGYALLQLKGTRNSPKWRFMAKGDNLSVEGEGPGGTVDLLLDQAATSLKLERTNASLTTRLGNPEDSPQIVIDMVDGDHDLAKKITPEQ